MASRILINLIVFYQAVLSPDHSFWAKQKFPYGYCRFHPSCSEYMKMVLEKYGLVKGLSKGIWRILKCNPFSSGGEDMP